MRGEGLKEVEYYLKTERFSHIASRGLIKFKLQGQLVEILLVLSEFELLQETRRTED